MMKKYGILCLILAIICGFTACGSEETVDEMLETVSQPPTYNVEIAVKCNENLILSTYDVEISAGGHYLGTLEHGSEQEYSVELPEGVYTFRAESEEDSAVDGEVEFEVSEDIKLKCELFCKYDQIEVIKADELNAPVNSNELSGKKYDEMRSVFEEAGFTNIEEMPIDDLTQEQTNQQNVVSKISIGEISEFTVDDRFMSDAKVVIEYHVPAETTEPVEAPDYEEEPDDGNGNKSSSSLSEYYAKRAFEEYGESMYPYGFECHWFMDLINAENTGDTWYFKVGVTITNAFGAEYDTVAEGMVTGTDILPVVVQFYVSN